MDLIYVTINTSKGKKTQAMSTKQELGTSWKFFSKFPMHRGYYTVVKGYKFYVRVTRTNSQEWMQRMNEWDVIISFFANSLCCFCYIDRSRKEEEVNQKHKPYFNCNSAAGISCPVSHMKFLSSLWQFWSFCAPLAAVQCKGAKWRHQDMGNTPLRPWM